MFEVTIRAEVPAATNESLWLATALLEAPSADGPWEAIEAAEGGLEELATRHAQYEDGWYRLQWHDDRKISKFSDPVQVNQNSAPIRRLSVKR